MAFRCASTSISPPLQIAAEFDATWQLVSRFVYDSRAHVPDSLAKDGTTYSSYPKIRGEKAWSLGAHQGLRGGFPWWLFCLKLCGFCCAA